jgi:hypothetical protein
MNEGSSPELSSTALRLVEALRPHTPFADAIVRRQAERAGVPLGSLSEEDLPNIVPLIVAAASGFVDPMVIARLKRTFLRR